MGSSIYMTLAAMVLLSVFILSTNSLIQKSSLTVTDSEYFITAISLAQNVIDEAKTKAFDEEFAANKNSDSKKLADVLKKLTTNINLGRDKGEDTFQYPDLPDTVIGQIYNSTKLFDDFDDYNGYQRIVNTRRAETFKILSVVEYVDPENPDKTSKNSEPTLCKRMTVYVTSPYLKSHGGNYETVKLQYAMTY